MSTSYQDRQGEPMFVETGGGSAVRSHQSYDQHVETVCHHSGRYLARSETFPQWIGLLREQHDFPGLPELDHEFAKAAHAYEHQHLIWSRPGVRGLALMLGGLVLLGALAPVMTRRDQISDVLTTLGVVEFVIVYTLLVVGAVVSVGLFARGAWLLLRRRDIYHHQAAGQPPAVGDFPLLHCSYDIVAQERLRIDLGNTSSQPHVEASPSELTVCLYSDASGVVPLYQRYRQVYHQHAVGGSLHAGTIALENLRAIDCPALEFDHRLVLHTPVPTALTLGSYTEGPLVSFTTPYTIKPHVLFDWRDGQRHVPLECIPRLKADDSYTLEIHFRWLGDTDRQCRLEECRLSNIPPELGFVRQVELGRYDADRQDVIWRNLAFQKPSMIERSRDGQRRHDQNSDRLAQMLTLSVTFSKPILATDLLQAQPMLSGLYRCTLDGLLSQVTIDPERIWNAIGRKATGEQTPINIERASVIEGQLAIDVRRLSQEHESVCAERICYHSPLEHDLVARVVQVLVERCKLDLQRIDQAQPRLDPGGTLRSQLYYWDIVGRQYDLSRLDSLDVHVVISGYDHIVDESADAPHMWIDLRVRSLRDPRDRDIPDMTRNLLGAIAHHIRQDLGPGLDPGRNDN